MTVAVQTTANAGCRNGLKGEPTFAEEEERLGLIAHPRSNCSAAAGGVPQRALYVSKTAIVVMADVEGLARDLGHALGQRAAALDISLPIPCSLKNFP
jgi:hypothetical protein